MESIGINLSWTKTLCCLLLVLASGCKQKDARLQAWQEKALEEVNWHLGREIVYPDSALFLSHPEQMMDSIKHAKCKILTQIDADCSVCMGKFQYWKRFNQKVDSAGGKPVPIMLFISTEDKTADMLKRAMDELWPYLWAYDKEYEFADDNRLHDDRLKVVLVDEQNVVRAIGNPFFNTYVEEMFIKYIVKNNQ